MTKPFLAAVVLIALCAGLILGIGIPTDGTLVPGMCSEVSADKNLTTFQAEVEQSLNSINAVLKEA
jgi:hypothetical protein